MSLSTDADFLTILIVILAIVFAVLVLALVAGIILICCCLKKLKNREGGGNGSASTDGNESGGRRGGSAARRNGADRNRSGKGNRRDSGEIYAVATARNDNYDRQNERKVRLAEKRKRLERAMEERDKDKTRRALHDYEDSMETRDDRKEGKPTCDRARQMLEETAPPPLPPPEPKKHEDKGPQSNEYQEKRNRVVAASDRLSARELQRAIDDFTPLVQAYGTAQVENGLMRKASYQLAFIRTRDSLWAAMGIPPPNGDRPESTKQPTPPRLQAALDSMEVPQNKRFESQLQPEVAKIREMLRQMDQNRGREQSEAAFRAAGEAPLDDKALRMLRQIVTPTKAIHDVVIAFLLLLGEPEERLKDWNQCKGLLKTTGESPGRVEDFNARAVDPNKLQRAKQILNQYEPGDVHRSAAEAESLYRWSRAAVDKY